MPPKKKTGLWEVISRASNLQGLFSVPIMCGISSIGAMLSQHIPIISAFGGFGIFCSFLATLLILSICSWLKFKTKKNIPKTEIDPPWWKGLILWAGWKWIIMIDLFLISYCFFDSRPPLPIGIMPSNILFPIASYNDMQQSNIVGKSIIITAMPRNEPPLAIKNKRFENCQIIGPAVLGLSGELFLEQCRFGVLNRDPDSIFLETKSEDILAGFTEMRDCQFVQCHFLAICFAGPPSFIKKMESQLLENSPAQK